MSNEQWKMCNSKKPSREALNKCKLSQCSLVRIPLMDPWAFRQTRATASPSKPPGKTSKSVEVIRRLRHPKVHPSVELDVFGQPVGQAQVRRAHPVRVPVRTRRAEELEVAGESADKVVAEGDRVDELGMI